MEKKHPPGGGGGKNSRKCNRQIYRRFMERCSDFEMMSGVYDIDEVVFVTK